MRWGDEPWGGRPPAVVPAPVVRRVRGDRWRRAKRRAGGWLWRTGRRWMKETI